MSIQGSRHTGLVFIAPFMLLYATLLILPLVMGGWISLHEADLFGASRWAGLGNFARLAADPVFLQALATTAILTVVIVPVLTTITLLLALSLNRAGRTAALFRGVFFSSSVLSVTIVTLIWRFVLTPDGGLLAHAFQAFGLEPLPFLSRPDLVIPSIALTTIWWCLGLPMMLFLAGLQQIPFDIYEAAALDGAGRWTTFWKVTLPSLRGTLITVVMLQTAGQLQLFGQSQLLTGGGPAGASRTVVLFTYDAAFGQWELGYATAAAEVLFILVLALTAGQYWLVARGSRAR